MEEQNAANKIEIDVLKPHKLFLTIPEEQKETNLHFTNIIKEKNSTEGKIILSGLWLTYLVLTLLLIIVRKLFQENYTIFILRAIFLFLLLPLIPFLDKAFFKPTVKYFFWIVLLYGSITTLMQSQLSTDP